MSNLNFKVSSAFNNQIKAVSVETDLFEANYTVQVAEGISYLDLQNSNNPFRNCVFQASDLKNLLSASDCNYVLFSHTAVEEALTNKKYSTAIALGVGVGEFLYDHEAYISTDVNQDLSFSEITNFTLSEHLMLFEEMVKDWDWVPNLAVSPDSAINFESWLQSFDLKTRPIIINNSSDTSIIRGVYYLGTQIKKLLDLDRTKGIALFPVTIKNSWDGENPTVLELVTYIIAPVDDNNSIFYPNDNKFLISAEGWPHIWKRGPLQ